jgi:hypothetical protein
MKNKFILSSLVVFAAASVTNFLMALPVGPGGPAGGPTTIPVDGGIAIVLAACAGYGVKKYNDLRKTAK